MRPENLKRHIEGAAKKAKLDLVCDPGEKEAMVREVLSAVVAAGYAVYKPCTLEIEVPAQIRGALRIAHREVALGNGEMAMSNIEAALATLGLLEDYLRELRRLGTQVPLTWAEFVRGEFARKHLRNSPITCENSNGENEDISGNERSLQVV